MLPVGKQGPLGDVIRILALEPLSFQEFQGENRECADIIRTGAHWRFRIVREGLCSDAQATMVGELWETLPPGEVARCHSPGFALQFWAQGEIAFTAALCWQCNNISFAGSHAPPHGKTFDGNSSTAHQLLQICKMVTK